ncbi:MAG: FAD-dependent oxidoreductase [Cellvibrionaceae bacterium]
MNLAPEETSQSTQTIDLDIGIIGGGIAGLWLANRLHALGFHIALFEKTALGSDQTVASQGMIHGGIKYTLAGSLTGASESVADMPDYWKKCLAGEGDVDLTHAKTLSDHFYFWSSNSASSKMSTFFASKAVHGRVDKVSPDNFPSVFNTAEFSGQVYQLQDIVLDVPSVLAALKTPINNHIFLLPKEKYTWKKNAHGKAELHIESNSNKIIVRAKQFIFSAGKGNRELLNALHIKKPEMQTRPLYQVWVKHAYPHQFFGHCLGADSTPRLSISSHPTFDGNTVWSLGGSIAENGVKQSEQEVIHSAKKELLTLFPWLDFSDSEFIAVRIDRAEAKQRNFLRPDKAFVKPASGVDNILVAWPTKLTLAPNLSNEVVALLNKNTIKPSQKNKLSLEPLQFLGRPDIALPPWETPSEQQEGQS